MSDSFSPRDLGARLSTLGVNDGHHFVCAVSGGADSLALAHALSELGLSARLVHVNHHLQPASDHWPQQIAAFAEQIGMPFSCLDVLVEGERNLEAQAREARYGALAENLRAGEVLLTAHHQDDQALTLLIQLLRGAGPAGLAAMPGVTDFAQGVHARPLLGVPAEALQSYARERSLPVINDPSNADTRFARNYLRAQVVPALEGRWPAFARTLARSAAHCAQADALLEELAAIDAPRRAGAGGINLSRDAIPTDSRAENVLRYALRRRGIAAPATVRLQEFVRQVRESGTDAEPQLELEGLTLRSYERHVFLVEAGNDTRDIDVPLQPSKPLELPAPCGTLLWHASDDSAPLRVRFRRGGERYGQSPTRRLKAFFQERRVLPWYRSAMPLVYDGEQIVAIADLWQAPELEGIMVWYPHTHLLA